MKNLIHSSNYLAYKFNFNTENVEFLPIERNEIRQVSALKQENRYDFYRRLESFLAENLAD